MRCYYKPFCLGIQGFTSIPISPVSVVFLLICKYILLLLFLYGMLKAGGMNMTQKNKIIIIASSALLVICLAVAIFFIVKPPKKSDDVVDSSVLSSSEVVEIAVPSAPSSNILTSSQSEATPVMTHINTPEGWNDSSDKTKNSPKYEWPKILPTDMGAGSPILAKGEMIGTRFVLMQSLNPSLPFSVECNIENNKITAVLPAGTHIDALMPEFSFEGKTTVQNVEVKSGENSFNFTEPVEFTVENGGEKTVYTVYIMTLDTGLPSISISVNGDNNITSKTDYVKCNVFAGGGDSTDSEYSFGVNEFISAAGKIKGRGWTSWYYYPKKSYTLKFEEKQKFPGLPAHKEWVLSANHADRTLIRNAVAMELAHSVKMEAVMDVRFVDLWVNGYYEGGYQLIEKIEDDQDRVNITKFDENLKPEEIGFIVETTGHNKAEGEFGTWTNGQDADRPSKWQKLTDNITLDPVSGDMFFDSLHYDGIIYNVKKPSDSKLLELEKSKRDEYLEYIYNYMDDMEAAIKSRDFAAASQYLDMDAMAKWYIVEELTMNTDSRLHCSCYMYKDAGGKMKMGPVWDFDLGLGNGKYANENHAYKTYLDGSRWFSDLTAMPEFRATVKRVWTESLGRVQQLPQFVATSAAKMEKSQAVNYSFWSITEYAEHTYARTTEGIDTYEGQIAYLSDFVNYRITYMNDKISNW